MPSLDELYQRSQGRLGPYGPDNPAPPPAGPPPDKQRKEIKIIQRESADADEPDKERGRDLYQRRDHTLDTPQRRSSPYYGDQDERRGRPRSSSPDHCDKRQEHRRYRERSSRRSKSTKPPRERRETPSYESEPSRGNRRSPSVRRSVKGRYRSRSPRRSDRHYHYHYHEEKDYTRTHTFSYTRRGGQRSLTPVAVRERRIRNTDIPKTAYPLRDYTNYISKHHAAQRRITSENRRLPAFRNGDGKVNPSAYGSVLQYDFGLCYGTFKTMYKCEMGVKYP
ncbi:hypothetical protein BU23DRAFT_563538 [Bimuria novae-zelandiae CBS 107.79]|uniref:Uncharacterized protein n=1 Tax=Bimuria novae-zelandiae CBS 107.79 TaxID=1447943 RepID=A0A6A5VNP1_9PLEO|nr:hypothetical protein BU23DRAFT_563538 [Bimuria novae-zelandiae CBS 107.79]